MNDNQTVLHNPDNRPAPAFIPEFNIARATGYAVTDDGMTCVLRTLTSDGVDLRLIIPTIQVESVIAALRAVKLAAMQKAGADGMEAGRTAVFTPTKYETITVQNYAGVLLAFDRETETEIIIGLDHEAARNMGKALTKQSREVANRSHLILPDKGLIG